MRRHDPWGHTQAMIQRWYAVVWVDRDDKMIAKCKAFLTEHLTPEEGKKFTLVKWSYAELPRVREESGVQKFDYILLDIGVNMDHFKEADRGFSIKLDGELDMRYDTTSGESVATWLARANYQDVYNNLTLYSDFSDKQIDLISKELVQTKRSKTFKTTNDVREWAKWIGINDKKLAIIFQSRRIHVNKELDQLDSFLQSFTEYVQTGGRCAIISYHSWEDRRVKVAFKELEAQWKWTILTKHVIKPNRKEVKKNKAARSAKMRVFEVL